jgi:hypothetical protein
MSGPAYGQLSQLGIDSANPVTARFDYLQESLAVAEEFVDTNGLRGTLEHDGARVRAGIRRVGGQIQLQPTAVELALLLPWIFGTAGVDNVYALADTVPSRYVTIDRIAKVFTYDHVFVDKAVFSASKGSALRLTLDLVGVDEAIGNAGTFPSLSLDTTTGPFMFTDGALQIASTTYTPEEWELSVENHIDRDRFFNALVLSTAVNAMDRTITTRFRLPYGDSVATYNTGAGGVAVDMTFTNGGCSLDFSMVKVTFPRRSPTVPGRQEIMLPHEGRAWRSGSTKPLVTTLDSTP